ncbi:hypothetical protein CEUSTIGMA_g3907.t1 [Chlamydomonas eustigma]|uniref:ATP-dependent helicase C-terminal domain-containing protein n=1 Tax=Chlamydomonas eustigma TaxID=1157962 RepID=A0A250X0P0_9CHLO|nr:hypothetical protein CEUSTIGMA_g3907.t1 [Chlamydomonas eustigma]|eukprot:GAX76462.1 hypothetical protein CEUSTIGMA_g3907.t1 [Chlamydomonas eustigma]
MEINIENSILIFDEAHNIEDVARAFDEAHNIEDVAREAASVDLDLQALQEAHTSFHTATMYSDKPEVYRPLMECLGELMSWMERTAGGPDMRPKEFAATEMMASGSKMLGGLEDAGLSPDRVQDLWLKYNIAKQHEAKAEFAQEGEAANQAVPSHVKQAGVGSAALGVVGRLLIVLRLMYGQSEPSPPAQPSMNLVNLVGQQTISASVALVSTAATLKQEDDMVMKKTTKRRQADTLNTNNKSKQAGEVLLMSTTSSSGSISNSVVPLHGTKETAEEGQEKTMRASSADKKQAPVMMRTTGAHLGVKVEPAEDQQEVSCSSSSSSGEDNDESTASGSDDFQVISHEVRRGRESHSRCQHAGAATVTKLLPSTNQQQQQQQGAACQTAGRRLSSAKALCSLVTTSMPLRVLINPDDCKTLPSTHSDTARTVNMTKAVRSPSASAQKEGLEAATRDPATSIMPLLDPCCMKTNHGGAATSIMPLLDPWCMKTNHQSPLGVLNANQAAAGTSAAAGSAAVDESAEASTAGLSSPGGGGGGFVREHIAASTAGATTSTTADSVIFGTSISVPTSATAATATNCSCAADYRLVVRRSVCQKENYYSRRGGLPKGPDSSRGIRGGKRSTRYPVLAGGGLSNTIMSAAAANDHLMDGEPSTYSTQHLLLPSGAATSTQATVGTQSGTQWSTLVIGVHLGLWCMHPAVAMKAISQSAHTVVLTSGTLAPLDTFASELGTEFRVRLEAPHVVDMMKQVWAGVIPCGPSGSCLTGTYKNTSSLEYQDNMGQAVLQSCKSIPDGVLFFVSSYSLIDLLTTRWKATGLWTQLQAEKSVFVEPKESGRVFEEALTGYKGAIEAGDGALLIAVCKGKV